MKWSITNGKGAGNLFCCLIAVGGIGGMGLALGEEPKAITPLPQLEAYESWKMAGRDQAGALTSAATIFAPQGFKVELLHAATEEQDSWVGMAFDDKGRVIVAMEDKGLLRLALGKDKGGEGRGDQRGFGGVSGFAMGPRSPVCECERLEGVLSVARYHRG